MRSGGGGGEWNAATGAAAAASRRHGRCHARRCRCRGSLAWCPVSLPYPSPALVARACRRRRRPRNQAKSDWGRCSGTRQRTTTVPRRHVCHRCRRPLPLLLLLPLPLQLLPTPPSRAAPPGVFCLSQPPSGAGWHTPATLWMACRGKRRPRVSWQCPTGKPALARAPPWSAAAVTAAAPIDAATRAAAAAAASSRPLPPVPPSRWPTTGPVRRREPTSSRGDW